MAHIGNEEFGNALLEHWNALYRFALALTRQPTEAQDLVQETYLRALQSADHFATGGNLKGWLFIILRNAWISQRQAQRGREFVDLERAAAACAKFEERPDVLLERKWQRQAMHWAIEHLPVAYREILILRDVEDFSYREIAEILGCPGGTVMSRLCRAHTSLRQALRRRDKVSRWKTEANGRGPRVSDKSTRRPATRADVPAPELKYSEAYRPETVPPS